MALYIVPVPIGNLKDITLRAIDVLKSVDFIIAEDTRYSLKLLNSLGIKKRLYSYYKPKEEEKSESIVKHLKGKDGALITDSGTPLISDPGNILIRKVIEQGIEIISLPGPTAFVPALTNSGLPSDNFLFIGFSPRKVGKLKTFLEQYKDLRFTMIFYESPRRVEKFLETALKVFGDRMFSISKELTKKNEKVIRGSLNDFPELLEDIKILGEFVIVIDGNRDGDEENEPDLNTIDDIYDHFREKYGISRNRIKKILMTRKGDI